MLLEASGLTKRYGNFAAVSDLTFSVPAGEVYGFLGQNGAGKSTTIRMLLTLIRPSAGSIRLWGKELFAHRTQLLHRVGAIIEKPDLYNYLTAEQNLRLFGRLSGLSLTGAEVQRQLEVVGIAGRKDSKVKSFSQGMKQRLGIACALVHNPDLIVLDEPTNGLDPQGITDVRNLILQLTHGGGKTVLVSSHLLSEMELMADSMLIIDGGKKVAEGKRAALLDPANTLVELTTTDDAHTKSILQHTAWGTALQPDARRLLLRMHREAIPQFARDLVERGVAVTGLQPRHQLEEFFLSLTKPAQHVAAYTD